MALLAGVAGALAATQGSSHSGSQAYLNDLARHLHVSPAALTSAIRATDEDQLNAAVTAGHLTKSQAGALKQRIERGGTVPFFGPGFLGGALFGRAFFGRPFFRRGAPRSPASGKGFLGRALFGRPRPWPPPLGNRQFRGPGPNGPGPNGPGPNGPGFHGRLLPAPAGAAGPFGLPARAALRYLGITPEALGNDLRSGKSLAQIASSTSGKSLGGLTAALTAAEKARLDKAVSAGRITKQQEQQRLTALARKIGALLRRGWPAIASFG